MSNIARPTGEYGGFLPLELNLGGNRSYYSEYSNVLSFNTIKAAIPLIRDALERRDILVPYYLCPNVINELEKNFNEISFFYLNNRLLPQIDNPEGKLVYLVNYFGIMDKTIINFVETNNKTVFLIDNAHSFYNKPIIRGNVYNLYSCKKFFGVPDGGYLISEKKINQVYEKTKSSHISQYLIKSIEEGTNSCYQEKKEIDKFINSNYSGISVFSEKLLEAIDYEKIKTIRKNNFRMYHEYFGKINLINCEEDSVPYVYPLNIGKNIKKRLIEEKIYVPTLWSHLLQEHFRNTFEFQLASDTLFLPLDQRYGKEDIEFIINRVNELAE